MSNRPPPCLLAEVLRLAAIATRFLPGFEAAEVVRALRGGTKTPVPGVLARIRARLRWKEIPRPYGEVWTFSHYPFFATAPIPFVAVRCPDGQPAVLFERSPRRDLFPYVARLAVDRLCSAHGWRFPRDLAEPRCGDAIWDLLWLAAPDPRPVAPLAAIARDAVLEDTGAIAMNVTWRFDGAADRVWLRWDPDRLDRGAQRFDPEPTTES